MSTFTLPSLPYAYDALDAVIDTKTMETHHGKHHQAYIDKLNGEVKADVNLQGKSLDDIVKNVSQFNKAVRNNGGGHWNHSFFWTLMTAPGTGGAPSEKLAAAIDDAFGSMDAMQEKFNAAGVGQFGSGWAWLIVRDGKLEIVSTPNQDNPLMDDAPVKGTPILGNDVWEHAYYLKYQNRRPDYLKAWWGVVNWDVVSAKFDAAL